MKYRKKPVVIEAFQLKENFMKIGENCESVPDWAINAYDDGIIYFDDKGERFIKTLEGVHHASVGDYIIQDIDGELYPCKPDIFAKAYDSSCAEIRNPKVIIESDGDITVVYLDGENSKGKLIDFSFHADVETGERIVTFSGRRNKLNKYGNSYVENDKVAEQKFHYDSRESTEIRFGEVK